MCKRMFALALAALLCLCSPAMAERGEIFGYRTIHKDMEGAFSGASLEETDELVCENGSFALHYDEENTILKVLDKQSGYVWSSGRNDTAAKSMTKRWQSYAKALVSATVVQLNTLTEQSVLPQTEQIRTQQLENGLRFVIPLQKCDVAVTMDVLLTEEGLCVRIPDEEILRGEEYRLMSVMPLPFWGAAAPSDGAGYVFLPDGCGALVRFGATVSAASDYRQPVYGTDFSLERTLYLAADKAMTTDMQQVYLPVMGMVHGEKQNASMLVLQGGASYAELYMSPAGNVVDFYYAAPVFWYNRLYTQADGTTTGVQTITDYAWTVGAQADYVLLRGEEAGWCGMALRFREMLDLPESRIAVGENVPMMLNCLMAETAQGSFREQRLVLTTAADLLAWQERYREAGVTELIMRVQGYAGSVSRQRTAQTEIDRSLGSHSEFASLRTALEARGGLLLCSRDVLRVYQEQAGSNELRYGLHGLYSDEITGGGLDQRRNYLNAEASARLLHRMTEQDGWSGVALEGVGASLQSDFRSGAVQHRAQAEASAVAMLDAARTKTILMLESPNAYAAAFADGAFGLPLYHSSLTFETDCVPFLQMIYSGRPLFSTELIPGNGGRAQLLRMIAYGMYPQYTMTARQEPKLQDSNSNMLYATEFDQLFEASVEEWQVIDSALRPLQGLKMTGWSAVAQNLVRVTYEEGWALYVNFAAQDAHHGAVTVGAQDFLLIGPDAQGVSAQ